MGRQCWYSIFVGIYVTRYGFLGILAAKRILLCPKSFASLFTLGLGMGGWAEGGRDFWSELHWVVKTLPLLIWGWSNHVRDLAERHSQFCPFFKHAIACLNSEVFYFWELSQEKIKLHSCLTMIKVVCEILTILTWREISFQEWFYVPIHWYLEKLFRVVH